MAKLIQIENVEAARQLITPQIVNTVDGDGFSPLHWVASENGKIQSNKVIPRFFMPNQMLIASHFLLKLTNLFRKRRNSQATNREWSFSESQRQ